MHGIIFQASGRARRPDPAKLKNLAGLAQGCTPRAGKAAPPQPADVLSAGEENIAGMKQSTNALFTGIKTIKLTIGKTVAIVTDAGGDVYGEYNPSVFNTNAGNDAKRISWRALID